MSDLQKVLREVVLVAPWAGELLEKTAGPAFAVDYAYLRHSVGDHGPSVRIPVVVLRSLYGVHARCRGGYRIAGLLVVDSGRF